MAKTFYLEISEETCNYLQRLGMEVDGRLEVINRLFTNHASDTDASVLTSVPFKTYQKEYEEINAEYALAKNTLSNELQDRVDKKLNKKNVKFNWLIEDFNEHKVKIDVIGE